MYLLFTVEPMKYVHCFFKKENIYIIYIALDFLLMQVKWQQRRKKKPKNSQGCLPGFSLTTWGSVPQKNTWW